MTVRFKDRDFARKFNFGCREHYKVIKHNDKNPTVLIKDDFGKDVYVSIDRLIEI